MQHPNLCPIIGVSVDKIPNIYILTPYYKNGSLYDFLHTEKKQIDLKKRMDMAMKIALGLYYLHNNGIHHFHLSSKNIYLNDELNPKIADYSFHNLKELASVFLKYKNKNSYTSPELLKEPKPISNLIGSKDERCDVYSFGILLWELYTCTIPFNVALKVLHQYVAIDNYRPEITKGFNQDIANLIRICWDNDPNKRPSFKMIIEHLNKAKI
jgi:sterile alpha motif and leucine zipper-containing kinase AZK